jgi:hypothetical protein
MASTVADFTSRRSTCHDFRVGVRHPRAQFAHALFGHPTIPHEVGITLEHGFREQLAARDPDAERALQSEHHVQKVDRLGPEVSL